MKKIIGFIVFLVALVILSCNITNPVVPSAEAGNISVAWDAPTTYFDGTALPSTDIASYSVYWGTVKGGPYPNKLGVGKILSAAIPNLPTGTYYVVATVTTTAAAGAQESTYSNEVTKQVVGVPSAPTNLR